MSEQLDIPPEEIAPASVELPGKTLRAAREAKSLTVSDIAHALKFSPRQIEALEADDFSALPGVTFIRGAVRSYAKFLKLDPAPLLAMLDAIAPPAPPDVRAPQNMGTAMSDRSPRQGLPLIAASVFLILAAIVIGVWHLFDRSQPAVAVSDSQVQAASETVQPLTPPEIKIEQPAAVAPGAPPASSPNPAVATTPAPPQPPAPAGPPPGVRQLVFSFGDKSWVEVKDARQRIIFTGEQPAGSRQTISGKAPFQIVIGNAAKVELFDGQRQVDLKPYTRAEVARLTIE